ncbi:hypothetical protein D3C86_1740260 [compost metagenome]
MTSLVFLTANNAEARENSKISPFGTVRFSIAEMVSAEEVLTVAVAMALRSVNDLCVMSTILFIYFPLMGFVIKNFSAPNLKFRFDAFYKFIAGFHRCNSVF